MFQKTILKQLNFVISINNKKCTSARTVFSKSWKSRRLTHN